MQGQSEPALSAIQKLYRERWMRQPEQAPTSQAAWDRAQAQLTSDDKSQEGHRPSCADLYQRNGNVATAAGIEALLRGAHKAHPVARMCGSSRFSGRGRGAPRGTPTARSIAETSSPVSPTAATYGCTLNGG